LTYFDLIFNMRLLNALGLIPLVAGHTIMTTLYVDGENQGDGVCIRMNRDPEHATFPIEPLANDAMACGTPSPPQYPSLSTNNVLMGMYRLRRRNRLSTHLPRRAGQHPDL
jgi:hypothetical protein